MLIIDGAYGEGGGQILRTALSLSALLKIPVRIESIRANRKKTGLMSQHLTAVKALQKICQARVERRSSAPWPRPEPAGRRPGISFDVSTAGAMPNPSGPVALASPRGESLVHLAGGPRSWSPYSLS
jgi:RNA 3'-terminal phosphate cyclase (ATP)